MSAATATSIGEYLKLQASDRWVPYIAAAAAAAGLVFFIDGSADDSIL